MLDKALEQTWNRTSTYLERAYALVASSNEIVRTLSEEYKKYLDHNEFGLALDTLETIGEQIGPPVEYWSHLEIAALEMGLSNRAADIRSKILEALDQTDLH